MQIIDDPKRLTDTLAHLRAERARIALVPTMGALHDGHMALIERARRLADRIVVSIFVNPKQFGINEDFATYPRTREIDEKKLAQAAVDVVWVPTTETMYPAGFATTVSVARLGDHLCGAQRPGHFDGVATVVTKLLSQVRPDIAVFGEKDWQQLAIIRQIAADLNLGVTIVGAPIVREPDGLALSSRNAYLDRAEREIAAQFPAILHRARRQINAGEQVSAALADASVALRAAGIDQVDYLHLIDPDSLAIRDDATQQARIVAAVRIGTTRLIDNLPLHDEET